MSETSPCPQCGAELPQSHTGLCPACLLKLGLSGAIPAQPPDLAPPLQPPKRRRLTFAIPAVLLIAVVVAIAWPHRDAPPVPSVKLSLLPPAESAFGSIAISPDGRLIAFTTSGRDGKPQLWIRPLASLEPQQLAGTEGAEFPFWSPDSRSIAFFAAGKLKKISIVDAAAQILCDASDGRAGAWSPQGQIVFAPSERSALFVVPASGGVSRPLTTLDASRAEISHRWPAFLPDGRHFLFTVLTALPDNGGLTVSSLDQPRNRQRILPDLTNAAFADHYLLFGRAGTLLAQPFDPVRLQLSGSPLPVVESIGFNGREAFASFSASGNSALVYDSWGAASENQLAWFEGSGKMLGMFGETGFYSRPQLGPDGRLAAETREDPQRGSVDVWVDDLTRGVASRLTFDQKSRDPVWSPDGTRIAYASARLGGSALYVKSSNGAANEELLLTQNSKQLLPTDWSHDGRFLFYQALHPKGGWDLWILPLTGDRKPVPFLQSPFSEQNAVLSPNESWIAYDSDESGRSEVYVQAFPPSNPRLQGKWQISASGGSHPRWRHDGREIFYMAPDGMMVTVLVDPANLRPGTPQALFSVRGAADPRAGFALSPDGKRFLIPISRNDDAAAPATVVLNWTASVRP